MATIVLKTINPYFHEVWEGNKTFEVRFNDRDFKVGDIVYLVEYEPNKDKDINFSLENLNVDNRNYVKVEVTYILEDFKGLSKDYVCFSFKVLDRRARVFGRYAPAFP